MAIKRVLLLGDFSSVHVNLRDGLRELGVNARVASTGDGFKNYERDIDLGSDQSLSKAIRYPKFFFSSLAKSFEFTKNDVVQTMSPILFPSSFKFNRFFFLKIIRKFNAKFFYNVAGSDSIVYKAYNAGLLKELPYDVFAEITKDELRLGRDKTYSEYPDIIYNQGKIIEATDGVITNGFDYYLPYSKIFPDKLKGYIPFPVNVAKHQYRENVVNGKVNIFHGINKGREYFKGSYTVVEVLREIEEEFKDEVKITLVESVPFSEFMKILSDCNIYVDQINSYDTGMAALQAMALGKVVLTGAEPMSLKVKGTPDVPYFNATPNKEQLKQLIRELIIQKKKIPEWGFQARKYIEDYHDCVKVASRYMELWSQ